MTLPLPEYYTRLYDFAAYQNANPTRPLPGVRVNTDLNDVERAVNEIIDYLAQLPVDTSDIEEAITAGLVTIETAVNDGVASIESAVNTGEETLNDIIDDFGTMSLQDATAVAIVGGTITGMPDPTNPSDVATKGYVDTFAAGISVGTSMRLATAAVLPNSPAYLNGTAGVGATLISTVNGALTVDGVLAVNGDRVLVKNQAAALQNGVYTATDVGSAGTTYILTRSTDFDTAAEMLSGTTFLTEAGTQAGIVWALQTTVATVGTSAVNFAAYNTTAGSLVAGNNLSDLVSASTARTNLGLGTMALQAAGAVAITGGTIAGSAISSSTGAFTGASGLSLTNNAASPTLATVTNTNASGQAALLTVGPTKNTLFFQNADTGAGIYSTVAAVSISAVNASGLIAFQTGAGPTERMRIGTTSLTLDSSVMAVSSMFGTGPAGVLTRNQPKVLNAILWGCDPTGVTECGTIFNAMSAALTGSTPGGVIYFPAGRYNMSGATAPAISYPAGAGASTEFAITLLGDGQGATQFTSTETGRACVSVLMSNNRHTFRCEGITFMATANGSYIGLYVYTSATFQDFGRNVIRDCSFVGKNEGAAQNYWAIGLLIRNCCGNSITDCAFIGRPGDVALGTIGMFVDGEGTSNRTSIFTDIGGCHFNSLTTGIHYGTEAQGVTVRQTNLQPVGRAIFVDAGNNQLQLNVTDCQIDATTLPAIHCAGGQMVSVKGTVFVMGTNGLEAIKLGPNIFASIVGNLIISTGGAGCIGVSLASTGGTGSKAIITGNLFHGMAVGVYADTGATEGTIHSNHYSACSAEVGGPDAASMVRGAVNGAKN